MVSSNSATLRNQGTPNQSPLMLRAGREAVGNIFIVFGVTQLIKTHGLIHIFREYLNVWSLSKEKKKNLSLVWEFSQVETAARYKGGTEMRVQAQQASPAGGGF